MKTKNAWLIAELMKFSGTLILGYTAAAVALIRFGGVAWIKNALPSGALDYANTPTFLIGLTLVVLGLGVDFIFPLIAEPGETWRRKVRRVEAALSFREGRANKDHNEISQRLKQIRERYFPSRLNRRRWRWLRDY